MNEENHKLMADKEQSRVNRVYAAMVAMVIFSCIPSMILQTVAFILLMYVMISAYVLRARSDKESLTWNHMEYLIRTFWIASLFFVVGFVADVIFLSQKIDIDAINATSDILMTEMMAGEPFTFTSTMQLMAIASLVTLGPSLIYFVYRIAKGLARAIKGYRMNNVRTWF